MFEQLEKLKPLNAENVLPQSDIYETLPTEDIDMMLTLLHYDLTRLPKTQGAIHIGFGRLWTNLDIIATSKPDYAIFASDNGTLAQVVELMRGIFVEAKDRIDFAVIYAEKIQKEPQGIKQLQNYEDEFQLLKAYVGRNWDAEGIGFLASDENFEHVKRLILEDRFIVTKIEDKTLDSVKNTITNTLTNAKDLNIETLFLDNVCDLALQQKESLSSDSSIDEELKQKLTDIQKNHSPFIVIDKFVRIEGDKPTFRHYLKKMPGIEKYVPIPSQSKTKRVKLTHPHRIATLLTRQNNMYPCAGKKRANNGKKPMRKKSHSIGDNYAIRVMR